MNLRAEVSQYCSNIGKDPLLVQGAGGNVSWKDGNILWVKASGTWLAEALEKDIFVGVDLPHLQNAITRKDFSITPQIVGESQLRPSIETFFHALLPHKIVLHLHAVEILAHLVSKDCHNKILSLEDSQIIPTIVNYYKPGAELAQAVAAELNKKPDSNAIFLKNHGVIIGADSIEEINSILQKLIDKLKIEPCKDIEINIHTQETINIGNFQYIRVKDKKVNQLAINPKLFQRLGKNWAIYPDHVVFLGAKANIYSDLTKLKTELNSTHKNPELIFIEKYGVYNTTEFSIGKQLQLRLYYDILSRQKQDSDPDCLSESDIVSLLNWDAEIYRMGIIK